MNKKLIMLSIATAGILFTGCGGGGSSSSTPAQTISGNVIDPAVEGATVSLKCGTNIFNASSITDTNGKFTISNINGNIDLSTCTVLATGGSDGDDLTGLTLKSPYKLFNKKEGIYVTPFTTAVAEHDDLNTDVERAKKEVADFLGADVNADDIIKDPTSNVKLAKVTKKMTKIALSRNKNGRLVGYIDIDDSKVTQNSLDTYVNVDLANDLEDDEKEKLQNEISAVEKATNVEDVIKQSILGTTLNRLKRVYKKKTYTEQELTNLEVVAEKIVEANKQNNKYKKVTRNHIRKALIDLDITPAFSDQEQKVLTESLANTLALSDQEFINTVLKKDVDGTLVDKEINIISVNNLTLFNADNYEQVLGDDNSKRINYYTLSNKSNIAKALELAEDSLSDDVNDPINTEISLGLAKNGLEDLAIENIEESIYTRGEKDDAYKALAFQLLSDDKYEKAATALAKQFIVQKQIIDAKGVKNVSNFGNVQTTARRLAQANDDKKAQEVIDYLLGINSVLEEPKEFARIPQALRDLAHLSFTESKNLANAKKYSTLAVKTAVEAKKKDARSSIFSVLNTNRIATIFGDSSYVQQAYDIATELDKTNSRQTFSITDADGNYTGSHRYHYTAALALTDNFDTAYEEFKKISDKNKDNALYYGMSAAMVLNNKLDELENYYTPKYFTFGVHKLVELSIDASDKGRLNTPDILKARGENDLLEAYLDKLKEITQKDEWKTFSKSKYATLYTTWGNTSKNKAGYLRIAQLYKELGKEDKANTTVNEAVNSLSTFDDETKVKSSITLLWGLEELNLLSEENKNTIINTMIEAAKKTEDIDDIVKAANYLSKYKQTENAKVLLTRAEKLINDNYDKEHNGNLTIIKNRTKYLVGINNSSPRFVDSLANGYLQAGDKAKVISIIQGSNADIESLAAGSTDQGKLYIDIANAYAGINDLVNVKATISKIKTSKELDKVRVEAAKYLANYDAFSNIDVASIDSDGDGKPDFFNLGYTDEQIKASGLELDEDIDDDGVLDTEDTLPYDKIK